MNTGFVAFGSGPLAGAERSSALQRAGLAQVMPTRKPVLCPETCNSSPAALIAAPSFLRVIACWPQSCALRQPAHL